MLFSFRSCESDASPPCLGITATQTHASKSFMIISLSDDYIVAKSLVQVFCTFFFPFCHLVCVHCDGDIGVDDVGKRHSMYHGKTRPFQRKAFPTRQCRQPSAAWAAVRQVKFVPVLWRHMRFQQFTHFSCGLLPSMVCCCWLPHLCVRVGGGFPFSCTEHHRSRSP